MNQHCIFADSTMDNSTTFFLISEAIHIMEVHGCDALQNMDILRFCAPTDDGVPLLITARKDLNKLGLLFTRMKESKALRDIVARRRSTPKKRDSATAKLPDKEHINETSRFTDSV